MQGQPGMTVLPGSALWPHLLQTRVGPIASGQVLRVALRLESRLGDAGVLEMAMSLGRQAPRQRRYLTGDRLEEKIGPSGEALRAVDGFCRQHGFAVVRR